jgi:hypothetical protein
MFLSWFTFHSSAIFFGGLFLVFWPWVVDLLPRWWEVGYSEIIIAAGIGDRQLTPSPFRGHAGD